MKTTRYLDICTLDGKVIFSFCLTEREEVESLPSQPAKADKADLGHPPAKGNQRLNGNGSSEDKMTDPQQHKLFRLLAERGFSGEEAHKELLKRFKVSDLSEIGKTEASRMIDSMLKEGGK